MGKHLEDNNPRTEYEGCFKKVKATLLMMYWIFGLRVRQNM